MTKTKFSVVMIYSTILSMCSLSANAASIWHSGEIKMVYPAGSGEVVLTFVSHAPTCTNASNYHYVTVGQNGVTQDGLENMLSVLLTAVASGRSVAINFDDASSGCYVNRLYVVF